MDVRLYKCPHCGNIVIKVIDSGVPVMCCGQKMEEIIPASVDAAVEKHVPVVSREGDKVTVTVGSVAHPMTEAHLINLIILDTTAGVQIAELTAEDEPSAVFMLAPGAEIKKTFAYCNLHGLWTA
jgi:superoxide reductase